MWGLGMVNLSQKQYFYYKVLSKPKLYGNTNNTFDLDFSHGGSVGNIALHTYQTAY